jgi:Histidine kinase-, DNA gyrase B-, and HSP90-like ATPase/Prokaryotic E2 family A
MSPVADEQRGEPPDGGVRLEQHEDAIIRIPPGFPFQPPRIAVLHDRFAGLPHVQWGRQICLYHSAADWDPDEGMMGVAIRLSAWFRRAAVGHLDAPGQPLDPPIAYTSSWAGCIVIHQNAPRPAAADHRGSTRHTGQPPGTAARAAPVRGDRAAPESLTALGGVPRRPYRDGHRRPVRDDRRGGCRGAVRLDDGPGIPEDLQPSLFERFVRGDSSRSRTGGSTGLGLAIVDAVTSAHGGSVEVSSHPGHTRFLITLPRLDTKAPATGGPVKVG